MIDLMQDPLRPTSYVGNSGSEHPAEQVLRKLACWLGVGGYNAEAVDANMFHEKIVWGVRDLMKDKHAGLHKRLGGAYILGLQRGQFGASIKGLKTLESIRDRIDTELAAAKIEANAVADRIDANLKVIAAAGADVQSLFADRHDLVVKDADAVQAIVAQRLAIHREAEARRLDAERERIRAEEKVDAPWTAALPPPLAAAMVKPAAPRTARCWRRQPAQNWYRQRLRRSLPSQIPTSSRRSCSASSLPASAFRCGRTSSPIGCASSRRRRRRPPCCTARASGRC